MRFDADVVVIGAGIVGLATARALVAHPGVGEVLVVDKADHVAAHQSGHNSGVIHSGIYYRPGSAKATLVAAGRGELERLCDEHGVRWERCGKVIVATSVEETAELHRLHLRAEEHGIEVQLVDHAGLRDLEPYADGLAALHVPSTGIVDFPGVCRALARVLEQSGGRLALGLTVTDVEEQATEVVITAGGTEIRARWMVNCAGLQSDLVADCAGIDTGGVRIVPFRGDYFRLVDDRADLVRNLLYPVPDPRYPFLGVHFTRMIDGEVHAGPNAVLALAREGYRWSDVDGDEVRRLLTHRSTATLVGRHWRTGAGEVLRALRRRSMVTALRRLVPDLGDDDLEPAGSGVRAQAVDRHGQLVDDFVFAESARIVSVVNAPSPAATASLAIGRSIADRLASRFDR